MNAYGLGLVFSILVLIAIFLRLRNSRMQERYATWWLVIAIFVLVTSIFPSVLTWLAKLFGIVVPLNLAFFIAGVILLLISLQFSVDLSRSAERQRRLAEEIAILRAQVECWAPVGGSAPKPPTTSPSNSSDADLEAPDAPTEEDHPHEL